MYAEYLKLHEWRVGEAADGREALAKAISSPPDVVVTETRLPGINGYDLCEVLRRDATTTRIPIVVVTAEAYGADLARALRSGADAVLTKPCLPDRLMSEVSRLLRRPDEPGEGVKVVRLGFAQMGQPGDVPRSHEPARRYTMKRAHHRGDTQNPPVAPPALLCPDCDRPLTYARSHVGGVSSRHPEQWDYYECGSGCGTFQYRTRTRKLRKVC